MQKAHGNRGVYSEAVEGIGRARPRLWQALNEDADNYLGKCHHSGLVLQDDILEFVLGQVRPQVRPRQEAACLGVLGWDLTAHDEGLEQITVSSQLRMGGSLDVKFKFTSFVSGSNPSWCCWIKGGSQPRKDRPRALLTWTFMRSSSG